MATSYTFSRSIVNIFWQSDQDRIGFYGKYFEAVDNI